mgnify:CR=1 FL=1
MLVADSRAVGMGGGGAADARAARWAAAKKGGSEANTVRLGLGGSRVPFSRLHRDQVCVLPDSLEKEESRRSCWRPYERIRASTCIS